MSVFAKVIRISSASVVLATVEIANLCSTFSVNVDGLKLTITSPFYLNRFLRGRPAPIDTRHNVSVMQCLTEPTNVKKFFTFSEPEPLPVAVDTDTLHKNEARLQKLDEVARNAWKDLKSDVAHRIESDDDMDLKNDRIRVVSQNGGIRMSLKQFVELDLDRCYILTKDVIMNVYAQWQDHLNTVTHKYQVVEESEKTV